MSADYRRPEQRIPYVHAVAHRLRRVYLPVLLGLFAIWLFHLSVYGDSDTWIANAAIEDVPGYVVGAVSLLYVGITALALIPNLKEEPSDADLGDLESRE